MVRGPYEDCWFILRVDRFHLNEVALELNGYLPTYKRMTKPSRKHQPVLSEVPIFGSWVFVPYIAVNYERCRRVDGVKGVMRYNGDTLWLTAEDLELIRLIEDQKASDEPGPNEPLQSFVIGERVKVGGLMQGLEGVVAAIIGAGWEIKVLIDGSHYVTIDYCLLTKKPI